MLRDLLAAGLVELATGCDGDDELAAVTAAANASGGQVCGFERRQGLHHTVATYTGYRHNKNLAVVVPHRAHCICTAAMSAWTAGTVTCCGWPQRHPGRRPRVQPPPQLPPPTCLLCQPQPSR